MWQYGFDVLDTGTEVNKRAAEQKEPRSFS
jgi:hypothetical protein